MTTRVSQWHIVQESMHELVSCTLRFGGSSFRLSDAIDVRQLSSEDSGERSSSKLAAICIGHRGFGRLPSDSGKQSTKA